MGIREHVHSSDFSNTQLRRVDWSKDLATVRRLFLAYRSWLAEHSDPNPSVQSRVETGLGIVDRLISELPGAYRPPRGDVILAFADGSLVACGALRELEPQVAEIKRVYVRADHRGPGFGPRLTQALLDRARELGYARVRVDALPTMAAAIQSYPAMGFERIPPFWPHPVTGSVFFEHKLRRPKRRVSPRHASNSRKSGR